MKGTATTRDAYRLLHDGSLTLAKIEHNGIRVDLDYLRSVTGEVLGRIQAFEEEMRADPTFRVWRKRFGEKTNLGSRSQLAAVLFEELGHAVPGHTATGKMKADVSALESVDLPFVRKYLDRAKLEKLESTYLRAIQREVVGEFIHPSFNLHTVQTFRSCVARGTLIEVVRDVSKHPKGIPIEDVREGDYVYCYDDNRRLTIRRVLWAGKTGHRKVVRLHWVARGKCRYVDVTPEHRVRLASGEYVAARDLDGADFRTELDSKHAGKIRTLALGRVEDRLFTTWHGEVLDHPLVYSCLRGEVPDGWVVHHKDGNHLNNTPSNLEVMERPDHSRLHAADCLTDEGRRKGVQQRLENHRLYGDRWPSGEESPTWIHWTKFQMLRRLAEARGRLTNVGMDFDTAKRKARGLGINLKVVKDRYNSEGEYISLGLLRRNLPKGRTVLMRAAKVNFYKLRKLLEERGLPADERKWANQFGEFVPGNHRIVRVEWLDEEVDVFDLEVEECHNFIANEICVHNSSSDPNFQNIPVRDKTVMDIIRRVFIPRPGRVLVEIDYSGIEVRIAYCYHQDPNMRTCLLDPKNSDMHRDSACGIYFLEPSEVSKAARHAAKNQFVFPQFYGSVYFQCAPDLWASIDRQEMKVVGGKDDGMPLKRRLAARGIRELGDCAPGADTEPGTFVHHLKEYERCFWEDRFPVYAKWKKQWFVNYLEGACFRMYTGFEIRGALERNKVINYPVQGAAFHCLLNSLIRTQRHIEQRGMESLLVGQIHDSMLGDVPVGELQEFLSMAHSVMTQEVPQQWKWIIIPLEVEADVTPEGGSWRDKRPWSCVEGVWQEA